MLKCGNAARPTFGRGRPVQRKIVVCGDGATGKTSLLNVFTRGWFSAIYEPTVFENYVHDLYVEDQLVELSLWDTAGQEEFDRLRSLSYAETHVVMLCFSVDNPTSLTNIEAKWIDEVLEYCPGVKLVLVALKCDLREDRATSERLARYGLHTVQYEEGISVARRIRASRY
ncbi:small GTPase superfamily [Fomitopsis serialis]|uniref:small GTPase superfamily n=1 Tax=Fomitopsis serialis TaxID=139415 RepID=UPI002008AC81|nr:small GTPase superfamily [Neoantrodia serialis]KAH9933359.1 small GTPase superfamily [Neoantrodia serialis]